MKLILSSALALAIAGSPLSAQEPDEKQKPKQQEPKKQPEPKAKPAQEPDDKPKPKPEKQNPAPPSLPKQQKPEEQQPDEKERQKQQKEQAKKEKNRPTQGQDSQQNGRQSGKGQRIPPEQFRANFGREHHFRITRSGGDNRQFHYGGYWFEVVEVWPAGWSFDEDCYLEQDGDDYYLVEVARPEIRVVVIVVSS
jgi:outer membrane biosynthesis protein TonB